MVFGVFNNKLRRAISWKIVARPKHDFSDFAADVEEHTNPFSSRNTASTLILGNTLKVASRYTIKGTSGCVTTAVGVNAAGPSNTDD